MPEWLPAFPWYYWTILVLVLIVVALLEGSYREHLDLTKALTKDAVRIREIEAQEANAAATQRHAEALERQYRPPQIENMIESMRLKETAPPPSSECSHL